MRWMHAKGLAGRWSVSRCTDDFVRVVRAASHGTRKTWPDMPPTFVADTLSSPLARHEARLSFRAPNQVRRPDPAARVSLRGVLRCRPNGEGLGDIASPKGLHCRRGTRPPFPAAARGMHMRSTSARSGCSGLAVAAYAFK